MPEAVIDVLALINQCEAAAESTAKESFAMITGRGQGKSAENVMGIVEELRQGADWVKFRTDGAFSLYQLLIGLVELTGPCVMYCSTYAMSETSVRSIALLKDAGMITGLHCVVDNRIETRTAGSMQLLKSIATSCALAPCHAKATVLVGKLGSISIMGSANYTENKRIEVGMVTSDAASVAFDKEWILKAISEHG